MIQFILYAHKICIKPHIILFNRTMRIIVKFLKSRATLVGVSPFDMERMHKIIALYFFTE